MEFNLAQVHEAIAEAIPDKECIVFRDRRLTWRDVTDRTRRLANVLGGAGLGARAGGRAGLAGHESHEDHLAIYLYNGNEYLESMVGAFKARVAPINVNYRYVAEELQYLLDNSAGARHRVPLAVRADAGRGAARPAAAVGAAAGAPTSPATTCSTARVVRGRAGAASRRPAGVRRRWSPDDLYVLYTGGTTGMPEGCAVAPARHLHVGHGRRGRRARRTSRSNRSSRPRRPGRCG